MAAQEYLVKLAQLKAWMKAKHLPMHERTQIMAYFSANHQSATYFDEVQHSRSTGQSVPSC